MRGVPCIYVGPLYFKLRVQEKETKSEQNNRRKLSSNGEIKSAQSSKKHTEARRSNGKFLFRVN